MQTNRTNPLANCECWSAATYSNIGIRACRCYASFQLVDRTSRSSRWWMLSIRWLCPVRTSGTAASFRRWTNAYTAFPTRYPPLTPVRARMYVPLARYWDAPKMHSSYLRRRSLLSLDVVSFAIVSVGLGDTFNFVAGMVSETSCLTANALVSNSIVCRNTC